MFFQKIVFADDKISFTNPLVSSSFKDLVNGLLNMIFTVSLPLTILLLITGAILIATSGGDEKRIEMGKKCIIYTLIGFILILISKGILGLLTYLTK